jgi:hypothetical protein
VKSNAWTHKIQSAQDGALVRAVLLPRAALCSACIAHKAGLPRDATERGLMGLSAGEIVSAVARCDACRNEAVVHRLG